MRSLKTLYVLVVALWLCLSRTAVAEPQQLRVGVASNFMGAAKELVASFEKQHDVDVLLSFASSGKLFAQLSHGAPYDVFLSADTHKPQALVDAGRVGREALFIYAYGRLALTPRPAAAEQEIFATLKSRTKNAKIALANPRFAPYGQAARQVLQSQHLWSERRDQFVFGENVAQAFHFLHAGSAQYAFVAYAQLLSVDEKDYWLVPEDLHSPIVQQGVLLNRDNNHAECFVEFIQSAQGQTIIHRYGYTTEPPAQ